MRVNTFLDAESLKPKKRNEVLRHETRKRYGSSASFQTLKQ